MDPDELLAPLSSVPGPPVFLSYKSAKFEQNEVSFFFFSN